MYRNTITYKYMLLAGILTASVAILAFLDLLPHNETFAYAVLLPIELFFLPVSGICGIVLLVMDLIFKKQLPPARFNNKILIAIEWILIAGYVYITGYMIFGIITSYLNNPLKVLSIIGFYFGTGAVAAAVIRIAAFKLVR